MVDETTPETEIPETDETAEAAAESGPEQIAALEAEIADLKDRLLRTLAEMENLRRRNEREMTDTRQYSVASFARDMLTVAALVDLGYLEERLSEDRQAVRAAAERYMNETLLARDAGE